MPKRNELGRKERIRQKTKEREERAQANITPAPLWLKIIGKLFIALVFICIVLGTLLVFTTGNQGRGNIESDDGAITVTIIRRALWQDWEREWQVDSSVMPKKVPTHADMRNRFGEWDYEVKLKNGQRQILPLGTSVKLQEFFKAAQRGENQQVEWDAKTSE